MLQGHSEIKEETSVMAKRMMTSGSALRVCAYAALALLLAVGSDAKCAMTQKCVNPGNVPDYDACIPEANPVPVDPQPVSRASNMDLVLL